MLENLKLRESPSTAGAVITTLEQGIKVTILEIGQSEVIDDVSDKWVKVKTASEEEGWCFGLYLRETRLEPTPEELAVKVESEADETEDIDDKAIAETAETGSGFKIIPIAGIAVLLGGGTVVFVIKRRRH